ncbi:MAG: protein FxsA [Actinomycetota bacterium]|nr:protein FxsA [Actinomycetota bacterium]
MRALLILFGLIAWPIAEIWLVVWLVGQFGWAPVLIAGAVLLGLGLAMTGRATRAWSRTIERAQADPGYMNTGFGAAMGDAGLLFVGGILLILPGFISGAVGLVLVFPPTRTLIRRGFGGRVDSVASARGYRRVTVIEGETVVRPPDATPPGPQQGDPGGAPRVIMGEIMPPTEGPQRD